MDDLRHLVTNSKNSCVITGCGVTSSVGRTSAAVGAAIRAGVSRPRPVRDLGALDGDTQEVVSLVAHPAEPLTEGFYKLGRWFQLARGCLAEAVGSITPGDARQPVALYLVSRHLDDEFLQEDVAPDALAAHIDRELTGPLCEEVGLSWCGPGDRRLVARGSAGTAAALAEATTALAQGRYGRALILAVDSWIDPMLVDEAAGAGRLKSDDNPMGLVPGEAAVALSVEPEDGARRAGRVPLAVVERIGLRTAQVSPMEEPEVSALLLGEAIEESLAGATGVGDVFLDLTGEEWRARQWGTALVRLAPRLAGSRTHIPAVSVGDVGAASGALGVCLAVQSFARRWARTGRALVVSSSEWGDMSGISLMETRA